MLVRQAFRFELDPNDRTNASLASPRGASRYAFNWDPRLVCDRLRATRTLTVLAIRQGASVEEAPPWAHEVTGPIVGRFGHCDERGTQRSARCLRGGLRTQGKRGSTDWPEPSRSKGRQADGARELRDPQKDGNRWSCQFSTNAIGVTDDRHVRLPRLGQVRTKEQATTFRDLLDDGPARICSATVCEQAGR